MSFVLILLNHVFGARTMSTVLDVEQFLQRHPAILDRFCSNMLNACDVVKLCFYFAGAQDASEPERRSLRMSIMNDIKILQSKGLARP